MEAEERMTSTTKLERSLPTSKGKVMSVLEYYLTFIHYFGFSINPTDTRTHYLALRIKRERETNSSLGNRLNANQSRGELNNSAANFLDNYKRLQVSYRERSASIYHTIMVAYLKKVIKLVAILLTGFLALNHFLVLTHYIYDDDKSFIEMMFQVRLVLTKLSALIFVLSWHYNQKKVRQLMKLIKSTSIYILGTGSYSASHSRESRARAFERRDRDKFCSLRLSMRSYLKRTLRQQEFQGSPRRPGDPSMAGPEVEECEVGESLHANNRLIERRVVKWWLMCVCVTITHFSLSEAEIVSDDSHLWEWIEDYSFHWLNNSTISHSTLMFLATFDNYIYTVHSYGARLFGASIICIVCNLQSENICSLKHEALEMVRPSSNKSTILATRRRWPCSAPRSQQLEEVLRARRGASLEGLNYKLGSGSRKCGPLTTFRRLPPDKSQLAEGAHKATWPQAFSGEHDNRKLEVPSRMRTTFPPSHRHFTTASRLSAFEPADRRLFFILGESNWFEVRANTKRMEVFGLLSSTLLEGERFLAKLSIGTLKLIYNVCEFLLVSLWACLRAEIWKLLWRSSSASSSNRVTPSADPCGRREERAGRGPTKLRTTPTTPNGLPAPQATFCEPIDRPRFITFLATNRPSPSKQLDSNEELVTVEAIESQLEKLVNKYELVRTVNSRIDNCFGPMLLIQFSFLFLMSCIDLVYFSISFNPTTRTKYIIMSGMILLWWPYILMYKFASDIASGSRELLLSVRHLARLSIIEYHSQASPKERLEAGGGPPATASLQPVEGAHANHPDGLPGGRLIERLGRDFGSFRSLANAPGKLGTPPLGTQKIRVKVINKLDHVFEPIHLSLMGITSIDKFFLLSFAKIVITTSVMIIQFITN